MKFSVCVVAGTLAALGFSAMAGESHVAFSADVVVTYDGKATTQKIWSDGVRTLQVPADATSGWYSDSSRKLVWLWNKGSPCIQISMPPPSENSETALGRATIAGHPTQKVRVTYARSMDGKSTTVSQVEWRAADLDDLVIRRESASGSVYELRNIVRGPPAPEHLAFPSPPCKYDAVADTTGYQPQAPGGYRRVAFFDIACKKIVPLKLAMQIPSDFEIRLGGRLGCFAGTHEDLDRLLKTADEVDLDSLRRGVIWVRISMGATYDPIGKHFIGEQGSDEHWAEGLSKTTGAANVKVVPGEKAGIPSLTVHASVAGKPVRMLYLGVGDSPAILISYQAPKNASDRDETEWKHFLDSFARAESP